MKLAIVCDDLIQFGGAEKIVEELSDMYPDAPLYTSVASEKWLERFSQKGRIVKISFLQKFPFAVKLNRYYSAFFLHTLAFESFDFSEFDVVISSSSRFAHHIITKPTTKHICYMHSPGRMFWESDSYFENEKFGFLKPFRFLSKSFLKMALCYLRIVDFNAAQNVDVFIANSLATKRKIEKYYRRDSEVIHPFINYKDFENVSPKGKDYFLVVTRLAPWKRVDVAVEACNALELPLRVYGEGPDFERLKSLASPTIEVLGYLNDKDKADVMRNCKALIVTQKEDFGIVPLEVMACGKPVIAYKAGGVLESIFEGMTGEFFDQQSSDCLANVLSSFDTKKYSPADCKERAKSFSQSFFQKEIKRLVKV
ncbi:MAG: glycosyltransferase [Patescibacteria group bacterium]